MAAYLEGIFMQFYHKIILTALFFTALVAGAQALPGAERAVTDLADPGFWMALGEGLVGAQESGWCTCS